MAIVGKYNQKRFLWLRKQWIKRMATVKPSDLLISFELQRTHYALILLGVGAAAQTLYAGHKVMDAREKTFKKNRAIIQEKFGEMHRNEIGDHIKMSASGYPDMGNNIYSMVLPHKAWLMINNAQRCHEQLISRLPILYTACFVSSLCYPKLVLVLLANYITVQSYYILHYNSKGFNRAIGMEETANLIILLLLATSFGSSLKILGVTQKLAKYSPVAWYRRRKLRKMAKTIK
eukprot:CAMPEP_0168345372 /NCGR_PEP_ID=MMETSP0213-20121227/17514_1 /TAXON_ID=151035 /ORGANISM="Euplotes harpa, Strain FSP1.4" /LENGTH=232 /DNA_ID=CAMNT_0008353575 /DNA_START=1 /DNA_END=699 /DNA_ORIENTATION=+